MAKKGDVRFMKIIERAVAAEATARGLPIQFIFENGKLQPSFPEELLLEMFGLLKLCDNQRENALKKLDHETILILSELANV